MTFEDNILETLDKIVFILQALLFGLSFISSFLGLFLIIYTKDRHTF